MKKGIHPEYKEAVVKCACGAEHAVLSSEAEAHIGICSKCHPFYTGKQKLVDTEGRIDRFRRKYNLKG